MSEEKNKLTPISELGEFGLIRHLTENIKITHSSTKKGVGDDAAVLEYGGSTLLVTSDILTEGVHFNLMYTPLKHLGYKAAIVNFSDIFAMNGEPRQMIVSMGISSKFAVEHITEIYQGLQLACEKYNVDLVGGDTTASLTGLTISVTVIGEGDKDKVTYRHGAGVNDLICVSGNLGAAYTGLQVLERENKLFQKEEGFKPELEGYDYVLERQLKPEARMDICRLLKELKVQPTSMIDISDGLSSELLHICTASEKGCEVYQDKIPVDKETARVAEELNLEPTTCALNGGEDYELLFTVPLSDFDKIAKRPEINIIGHITETPGDCKIILPTGEWIPVTAQGWDAMPPESRETEK